MKFGKTLLINIKCAKIKAATKAEKDAKLYARKSKSENPARVFRVHTEQAMKYTPCCT